MGDFEGDGKWKCSKENPNRKADKLK